MTALVSLLMWGMIGAQGSGASLNSLDPLQWDNRIVLVYRPEDVAQTVATFQGANDEVVDRDILWFVFIPEGLKTNFSGTIGPDFSNNLTKRFFSNGRPSVLLIGKDGGVKDECTRLDLPYLFYLIDQMPMRQQEMRS